MCSVSAMCPSSWHLGTKREPREHSNAYHMHPIPSMRPTESQVQLIPPPAQAPWHIHHLHVPQPHVKIPIQGSHTSGLRTSQFRLVLSLGICYFCMGLDQGHCGQPGCAGLPLLGTAPLVRGSRLAFTAEPSLFVTCLALHSPWSLSQVSLDFALEECWL